MLEDTTEHSLFTTLPHPPPLHSFETHSSFQANPTTADKETGVDITNLTEPIAPITTTGQSAILYCKDVPHLKFFWEKSKRLEGSLSSPTNWLNDLGLEVLLPRSGVEESKDKQKKQKRKPLSELNQQYKAIRKIMKIIDAVCFNENGETFTDLLRKLPEERKFQEEVWKKKALEQEDKKKESMKMEESKISSSALPGLSLPSMSSTHSHSTHSPMLSHHPPSHSIHPMLSHHPPIPSHPLHADNTRLSLQPSLVPSTSQQVPVFHPPTLHRPTDLQFDAHPPEENTVPIHSSELLGKRKPSLSPDQSPELKKPKKNKEDLSTFPSDMKSEWGFSEVDAIEAYQKQMREGKNTRLKWQNIAKQLGNPTFQQLNYRGERIRILLRKYYPDLVPSRKREISKDPKEEWGFDADDIKKYIEEYDANPDPDKGKLSMRKIGEMLGNKVRIHPQKKPFAERNDRNQLVHCILKKKYPELAKRFERKSSVVRGKKKNQPTSPSNSTGFDSQEHSEEDCSDMSEEGITLPLPLVHENSTIDTSK